MENLVHRGFGQLRAHQQDQARHHQAGDVLHPPVAEGMARVGLFPRQAEAQQRHHRGARIRQVVEGVRRDGDGAAETACRQLSGEQQQVQGNANEAAQRAPSTAHRTVRHLFAAGDEPFCQ